MLLNNYTYLDIIINGTRLNISEESTLVSFRMISSEFQNLPGLEFTFITDMENVNNLEASSCSDDFALIEINIGPSTNNFITVPFRLVSWSKREADNGLSITVIGIYSNLPYLSNKAPILAEVNTTYGFFKTIADNYLPGMKNSSITQDTMLRGTFGKSPCEAITFYTASASDGKISVFKSAIDLDGKLVFANILDSMKNANKNIKSEAVDKNDIFFDYIIKTSKFDNTMKNAYGYALEVNNIIDGSSSTYAKVGLNTNDSYSININKNGINATTITEFDSIMDIGNVSKEYFGAKYVNKRYSGMINNSYMGIAVGVLHNLDILSGFNLYLPNMTKSIPVYVSKKIISIIKGRYEEDYILNSMYTPKTAKFEMLY